jgi:hypothetical protein
MSIVPAEPSPRMYTVRHYRYGDSEYIWVGDELGSPNIGPFGFGFSRTVSLKWKWWHRNSPAARLKSAMEEAQAYADKLNRVEMYFNHEREIGIRQ